MTKNEGPSREDLHRHLGFIQAVVTRMSAASTSVKSWLLPVVTAAYGYGVTQNAWPVIALGLGAVLLFAFLDAHYLDREKAYRALYDAVAREKGVPLFSLDPGDVNRGIQAEGSQRDITPDEAEDQSSDGTSRQKKKVLKFETLAAWRPDPSVWKSWAITPFYGSMVLVGLLILGRITLF